MSCTEMNDPRGFKILGDIYTEKINSILKSDINRIVDKQYDGDWNLSVYKIGGYIKKLEYSKIIYYSHAIWK